MPIASNSDLVSRRAEVVTTASATVTASTAQHRVACDSLAHPGRVDAFSHCSDPARPFVSDPQRVVGLALVQIGHLPGVELGIGAADANPFDVDYYLAGIGSWRLNLIYPSVPRSIDHECAHRPSIPPRPEKCVACVTVPTLKEADTNNELRGLGDLLGLAVDRVTTPLEGVHRAIIDRSLRWTGASGATTRRKVDAAIATFYDAIRLTGSALGATVGLGATVAVGRSDPLSGSRLGSRIQAAINATWGDELEHRGNEIRIEMGLRNAMGSPVQVTPEDLTANFPTATARLVLLVHGLGRTESSWLERGEQAGLWEMLTADTSVTPVMVRYNSGRHISENGADLAQVLERLWRSWPIPLQSISLVGHSMGGLVIRSACRVGRDADQGWVDTVDKVVTVATPHLGAPLEKVANVVSWGLRATPESSPLADFLDARSVGIKDLRFGAIVDEDWLGSEPDALLRNTVSNVPPLHGVDHHFVAAVITSDPAHPVGALVGDLMVRPASGTGQGRRRQIEATDVRVLGGRRHFDLLHDPEVLEQVLAWLSASKTRPTESTRVYST